MATVKVSFQSASEVQSSAISHQTVKVLQAGAIPSYMASKISYGHG